MKTVFLAKSAKGTKENEDCRFMDGKKKTSLPALGGEREENGMANPAEDGLKIIIGRGLLAGGTPGGFIQPDLFGLEARRGRPVEGAVHDLAHLVKPPVGAVQTALAPGRAGATVRAGQTQFHLLLIRHISNLSFNVAPSLARGVGQRVSK